MINSSIYSIYICTNSVANPSDNKLFWKAGDPKLRIESASLDMEINHAGKLTITIPKQHPYRNKIKKRLTRFIVTRHNDGLWSGRVLEFDTKMNGSLSVTAEGALTYLLDTVQPPYKITYIESYANRRHIYADSNTGDPSIPAGRAVLSYLLQNYNANCDADKKFVKPSSIEISKYKNILNEYALNHSDIQFLVVSDNPREEDDLQTVLKREKNKKQKRSTITDASYDKTETVTYNDTQKEISENVIKEYGGFIITRYDMHSNSNYIIYCANYHGIKSPNVQKVKFGRNLQDLSIKGSAINICTRVIPTGMTYSTIENIRKKAYAQWKKNWDKKNVTDYNDSVRAQKKADKEAAEAAKQSEEDACGYTQYKEDYKEYKRKKKQYEDGEISTKPNAPEKVDPPKNDDGDTKTLKDYGYNADSASYETKSSDSKQPSWEDSGYAMPESVNKNTKVFINDIVNLYYRSKWNVKHTNHKNYVEISELVAQWGRSYKVKDFAKKIIRASVFNGPLTAWNHNPNTVKTACTKMWSNYIKFLKEQAEKWLKKNARQTNTVTITAIDLALLGIDCSYLDAGYSIPIESEPHGIFNDIDSNDSSGARMLCSAVNIDLLNPTNNTYTIGSEFKTLSSESAESKLQQHTALSMSESSYSM